MAKSPAERPRAPAAAASGPGGYFHWSRDAAVGLFAVLPLWLLYEGLRLWLSPDERNGAEHLLLEELGRLGGAGHWLLTLCFGALLLAAARSLVRREVPWARVAAVIALEGTVYALMLGPLASAMAASARGVLATSATPIEAAAIDPAVVAGATGAVGAGAAADEAVLLANLVGSLGAGIFEELVFRLGLMSALVWFGLRIVRGSTLPRWPIGVAAVVASALVFSWFHHLCGQPFALDVFLFRTMAGILLGALMWARGYGVCVYTHAIYDVHYYVSTHGL